jgi:hypothetical protein
MAEIPPRPRAADHQVNMVPPLDPLFKAEKGRADPSFKKNAAGLIVYKRAPATAVVAANLMAGELRPASAYSSSILSKIDMVHG